MNEEQIRRIVAETVAETLIKLGIDASEPRELQADMLHVRSQRLATQKIKTHAMLTAIGIVTVAALAMVWSAITKGS